MNRKLISMASALVAVFGLLVTSSVADAQMSGGPAGNSGNCPPCGPTCHSCCQKLWCCMYGQMVPDGTGGMIRAYGYPPSGCYGMYGCDSGYQPHGALGHRQRGTGGNRANNSFCLHSSGYTGATAACCTATPAASYGNPTGGSMIQPAYMRPTPTTPSPTLNSAPPSEPTPPAPPKPGI